MSDSVTPGYEPVISYSIKDILARVEGKLDAALISVASKAEQAELVSLERRVNDLEIAEQNRKDNRNWRHQWRQFFWPTILSAGALVMWIVQTVHH